MKVGIAQLAPVVLDREQSLHRVLGGVHAAADAGCAVVAFGEAFLPGYPLWLCRLDGARFDHPEPKALHARYLEEAVDLDRGDLAPLCEAARSRRITVVVGIIERPVDRGSHSLFCAAVVVDAEGRIASVHRKLMPTYEERLAWASGDGQGLVTHEVGPFRLGALNCWENWMPLARVALYAAGEDLHVMLWPGCALLTEDITRFVAKEGRCYVLSASALIRFEDLAADMPSRERIGSPGETFYDGGSCIAAPDGSWVVPPVVGKEELIVADLDPRRVAEERQNFDPSGHYARPDVLRLTVDRRRQTGAMFLDS